MFYNTKLTTDFKRYFLFNGSTKLIIIDVRTHLQVG